MRGVGDGGMGGWLGGAGEWGGVDRSVYIGLCKGRMFGWDRYRDI